MIYRDDQEALRQRLDGASREAEQLRKENEAMRAVVGRQVSSPNTTLALPPSAVYTLVDIHALPLEERARLAVHGLRPFPVWLVGILNVLTFGLFPMIHFGMMHDKLPKAAHNDPSAGKAIGYQFIPYYNLYWIFFSALRLCDRLSLQLRLRGLAERAPRGLVLAACIVSVIPYLNLLIAFPVLWTIAACMLQSTVNRVAALRATEWDATVVDQSTPSPGLGGPVAAFQPSPDQVARQARAQTLVNWSHVLGWGGLASLFVGTGIAGVAGGPVAGGIVGVLSGISVVVGGIIGQVGRGMQGRAI
jgi:hypothetical protein